MTLAPEPAVRYISGSDMGPTGDFTLSQDSWGHYMSVIDLSAEEVLTSEEAAKFLQVNPRTFMNKRSQGCLDTLNAYKMPGVRGYRYLKSDLINWLTSFNTKPTPKPKRGRPRKQA